MSRWFSAELSYRRSLVARRILLLFVLCALVPTVLAVVLSSRVVTSELERRAEQQLRSQVKEHAYQVYDRLVMAADRLRAARLAGDTMGSETAFEEWARPWFVTLVSSPESHRFAGSEEAPEAVAGAASGARPGSAVLDLGRLPSVRLGLSGDRGTLWGQIDVARVLWGSAEVNTLPADVGLAVLTDEGRPVFESSPGEAGRLPRHWTLGASTSGGGPLQLDDGDYLGRYWRLPLRGFVDARGVMPHLRFVLFSRIDATRPMNEQLRRAMWLSAAIVILVVGLFSMIQIRRTLVPLHRLHAAAGRLAAGELGAAVSPLGRDEFGDLALAFNEMSSRLKRQFKALETASEIDRAILSALEPERIIRIALTRLDDLLGASTAAIVLRGNRPDSAVVHRWERSSEGTSVVEQPWVVYSGLTEPREMQVDGGVLPPWAEALPSRDLASVAVAPLRHAGGLRGVVLAGAPARDLLAPESKRELAAVADQVAIALENASLVTRLEALHKGVLVTLARTVDLKSSWTRGHSERVATWAQRVGLATGLAAKDVDVLHRAGLVHDIGKIAVPDAILNKPERLSPDELAIVREHVRLGAEVLAGVPGYGEVAEVVWQHHEQWDGSGYPRGLRGETIHPLARLLSVIDVFDALLSARPYRPALSEDAAVRLVRGGSGSQFEPASVEAFLGVVESFREPIE